MIPFADVSLQQLAIQIFAIGTVAGRQVFTESHEGSSRQGDSFLSRIVAQLQTRRRKMAEFLLPKAAQRADSRQLCSGLLHNCPAGLSPPYTRRSSLAEFLLPQAMQLAMACSTWSFRPMSGT